MSSNEELLCDSADIRRGSLLGGGTFGQVYRSEHTGLGLVAERVVPSLPAEQEEKVREAMKALYRLRCDNATRLYGLVLQPDNCSLLMEYVQFGPVEELIKVKPPWAVRAKVMREVAMGLKYLHAHHVVHGNLSRHNVVIADDLVAKVTDFGLSEWRGLASNRQGGDTEGIADTPLVCTGPYAPPEAFTKSVSEAVTCSFDIYSYGILSWEVITSEQAWKGLSPEELRGEMQKGARPVLRGGQDFPAACPLTMRNITTDAWGQHPANRPAMSDIVRRFVKKKDVQWSSDELRKAENEAKKKLTDALRVSARARTPRHGAASAGLSSRDVTGLSPRGAGKTRHEERPHMTQASPRVSHSHSQVSTRVSQASTGVSQASPGVSQASPRGSQASPRGSQVSRHSTSLQAPGPPRKVTVPPGTKQGERKESQSVQKFKPRGSPADDPEKTKSSKPRANGSGTVRKNASSSGSLKSAARGEEDVRKASTQATDSSQFSRSSRSSAQILTRDEGFSESSFTEDQMSQDGSQGEAGTAGGQSADVPATQAEAAVGLPQVRLDLTEHTAILRADHEAGSDVQVEAAEERSEITLFSQPDHQGSGSSTPPHPQQAEPSSQDASPDQHGETEDEFEDEEAEPVTSQYRGQLQPDLVLDVQSEEQQSTGTDVQSEKQQSTGTDVQAEEQQSTGTDVQSAEAGDTDSDEEQILSSVDSQDETSVKVPLGEQIETRESDLGEEDGEENSTQQNDRSEDATTPQESQTLPPAQTLQHQSQLLSHGGTDRLLNEAGPVGEINQPAAEQRTTETVQQEQKRPVAEEMVTALEQLRADPQVSSPPYPAVIYYDETDPDIAEVMQVIQLLRRTWGLHVFDPHHDGVGDKMASFRESFENCQHAVAVLTPSVIRDMQDRRPNTTSFRIATFLTGLLETRDEHVMNTCQRRLIPVQIGHDEIPFILCNFHVLRFETSGFHRKLYRAVGSQTGPMTRVLRRLADQMPLSEDTVHTVAAMLCLPPEVLTDIKQEFGGNRAMLIEILECWCLHHGACATDVRLQQVVAVVTGGQGSCARGQDQVQPAAPAGQGSCVRGQDQVQPAAPAGQGSCARGQDQVQLAARGVQGSCVRGQDQAHQQFVVHQEPADIVTLLRTNRVQLIEVLRHPAPVMDHLYSRDVITTEEMDIVRRQRTPQDKARELLDIIASKGERGCTELKSALAEVDPHAATFLET